MQNIKHFFKLFSPVTLPSVAVASLLTACQPVEKPAATLQLQLLWQGQPWQCGQPIQLGQHTLQLETLQLYLSQFRQQDTVLLRQTDYSSDQAVLLGIDCRDAQPQATAQWSIPLQSQLSNGPLHFTLGLPEALNHQNPLQASSVFQAPDMHWNWQFGYKFFRLDLAPAADNTAANANPWSFHLGSTGCEAPSVMRAPTAPCQAPNRVAVTVNYQAGQQLTLDLAPLLQGITPSSDNSCMADRQVQTCQLLLSRLGLFEPAQPVSLFSSESFSSASPVSAAASASTTSADAAANKGSTALGTGLPSGTKGLMR